MRLFIGAKCSDMCSVTVDNDEGDTIHESDGYAPSGFGIGGGDYIELEIDTETGKIVNWNKDKFKEWLDNPDE